MTWDNRRFHERLNGALSRFDHNEVDSLCHLLVEHLNTSTSAPDQVFAEHVLGALRCKRRFGQLRRVADGFIQNGMTAPKVRKLYAQSLLDQGELSAAIPYLKALVADATGVAEHEAEFVEALGLLGRAYKQVYIHIGATPSDEASEALNSAIKSYSAAYEDDPGKYSWQGINTAALLLRAEADHIGIEGIDQPGRRGIEIAQEVLDHVSGLWENWKASMWDSGTAMEACVALGKYDEAAEWTHRYVSEPSADAFEIGSTLRQMEEVWQLDVDTEPGASILPVLRAELLQRQGGEFTAEAKDLKLGKSPAHLEKVLGSVRYHSYKFMLRSIERARAVARIEEGTGQGFGTGFLVRAKDLHQDLGNGYLLITNAHVVSDDPAVKDALAPEDAVVTFQLLQEEGQAKEEYSVSEIVWTSPPWKLDTTILRLDGVPDSVEPYPVHSRLPVPDGDQRVYVIGHPKGGALSFSIQDNKLLDHDAPYLHYRAPTEGGSSGSPVFNAQWKLIGLHHAGSLKTQKLHDKNGTYEANEGIWIQSVIRKMENELQLQS